MKVVEIPDNSQDMILRVLIKPEIKEAIEILSSAGEDVQFLFPVVEDSNRYRGTYWRWRMKMAEMMASELDPNRFGVEAFYVFGSTKNATAGPQSDIDILVHFRGSSKQRKLLMNWFEGWSHCLDQVNYMLTGYRTSGILDVHLVTDSDIEKKTSFASKIGAVTDAARPIPLNKKKD